MAAIREQIGWSVEAKLLYQILIKLDMILKATLKVNQTTPTPNT